MAKSLKSFPEYVRDSVAEKRVSSESGGLSFLAAKDYLEKKNKKAKEKKEVKVQQ